MRLILASGSQRRRELLKMCGYDYETIVSNADEHTDEKDPEKLVRILSERKAEEVYNRLISEGEAASNLAVLGSDTVVSFKDEIIGKPRDCEDAERILTLLSGKTHTVHTGVALATERGVRTECSTTRVTFSELTKDEIRAYIASGEPLDKAGAYGIQGPFGMFVERVEGNYFTVIGMPLPIMYRMLRDEGILPTMRRQG
ncbi:MAG: septum formation protein Maf [Eubacteriales bacterium]|nr:septum formation protein Maf [Eubacteriales bacterium]MCI7779294.1 Maf family protein [Clostridiales bacterium]MDD7523397.1 Maf family protein [Clostridiales bacterium]MDD7687838.1 Maf family protein [Clostridiales bacterium]MDY2597970.1 Maf family protein [Eubacteriales bacterium]